MYESHNVILLYMQWTVNCCISMLSCGTECCLKSGGGSSTPQKTTTTTTAPSHRLSCTSQETRYANCRNGGTCFVVLQRNIRTRHCRYWSSHSFYSAILCLTYKSSNSSHDAESGVVENGDFRFIRSLSSEHFTYMATPQVLGDTTVNDLGHISRSLDCFTSKLMAIASGSRLEISILYFIC